MFIKMSFLNKFRYCILDDTYDDILWVKFWNADSSFCVCVCYLPPDGSTRTNDAEEFYRILTEQVYQYQNIGNIHICGDFNSRCGEGSDYIEGVDDVIERDIIDSISNHYGDLLLNFLIDCNFCMLNGRVKGKNEFTHVSHRGRSVVDYVLIPHEQIINIKSMNVCLMTETVEKFSLNGCTKIPDHSVLSWEMELPKYDNVNTCIGTRQKAETFTMTRKRFNLTDIPVDFMNNQDILQQIEQTVLKIEDILSEENGASAAYSEFMELIRSEMDTKLKCVNKQSSEIKTNKMKYKKYWNDELQRQWSIVCEKERTWLKCKNNNKKKLKGDYCAERKRFDRLNRRFKRQYQRKEQEKLHNLVESDISRDFWKEIGKLSLANERKSKIPMEVLDPDGNSVFDCDEILNKWKCDYSGLFNPDNNEQFDNDHYVNIMRDLRRNTGTLHASGNMNLDSLNKEITYEEVENAVYRAKLRKATGFDGIPAEVLRNESCINLLYRIISYCFKNGEVPSEWTKGIINPIPKPDAKDARDPLNYRGISLLSVPYKIYADILNQRLMDWLEQNKVLVDEQNGFRKKRSCLEHIYSLYTIINNRKLTRKSTYVGFIDFRKAFDTVQRDFLWFKLMKIGINGRILDAIQSLYVNVQSTVKVNEMFSPWFPVSNGLKQGCKISPTLFSIYINDLAQEINDLNCGIMIDDIMVSTLLYADDIIFIAPNPESLQVMFDKLGTWSKKWRLTVNPEKTKVIHFRTSTVQQSEFKFKCGEKDIDYVSSYKYLGLWFNEHLNMTKTVTELAKSASRALSALYSKCLRAGGMTLNVFQKLYESLVEPVLFYSAGVWGISDFREIQMVQTKACRYFLGGGKCASNVALRGDMGWNSCYVKAKTEVFRLWMKLRNTDDARVLKCIHNWSKRNGRGWEARVLKLANGLNVSEILNDTNLPVRLALEVLKESLSNKDNDNWNKQLAESDKLRTYKTYKNVLNSEWYCCLPMSRDHRRILFKLRSCSLPIAIETGRYSRPKTPINERLCKFCQSDSVESETHFLLECELYTDLRHSLFVKASEVDANFMNLHTNEKLKFLMQTKDIQFHLGATVSKMFNRRKMFL